MTEPAGELTITEMRTLEHLRKTGDALVREIGGLEVRKAALLKQLDRVESQAQTVLAQVAARLNIPEGETWQATSEGTVHRVTQPAGP